ncbi:hypothetical protein HUN58_05185 [Curtobacterium sp. Csp1]|uniref:hypothetical protein n=1 Tax=unclassified Curtobacterium TaxID=257496 RepID=UPI00159A8F54|nr:MULTISPECIES: hypothetical protein [unclassified Curtobacterium]QKS13174.1 hypothetical protein HUN60_08485 [Curtobacterium sp. csp3]QKS19397.1 hypothetical protein HUN58_05185 [Curtobacterium sp. Csp1]
MVLRRYAVGVSAPWSEVLGAQAWHPPGGTVLAFVLLLVGLAMVGAALAATTPASMGSVLAGRRAGGKPAVPAHHAAAD